MTRALIGDPFAFPGPPLLGYVAEHFGIRWSFARGLPLVILSFICAGVLGTKPIKHEVEEDTPKTMKSQGVALTQCSFVLLLDDQSMPNRKESTDFADPHRWLRQTVDRHKSH